ncbi:MAG TPA: hypothetical protein VJG90_01995 [Candidatus Nanoarchaeia archaeon]|nr:hypothetical protein [Candidatus Nanoarchaeia archaeon]
MSSNNFICTGSTFVTSTTSTVLGAFSGAQLRDEVDLAAERIKQLLIEKKGKVIDLPMIVQELHIPTEIALKAIKKLRDEGYIKYENE